MALTVRAVGLGEVVSKLNFDRLVKPAIEQEVIAKVEERWMRRRRKGAGARNNVLTPELVSPGAKLVVASTLRNPRQSGRSWQDALLNAARKMTPNIVRKARQRIEEAWS